jgi:hypothetical protein
MKLAVKKVSPPQPRQPLLPTTSIELMENVTFRVYSNLGVIYVLTWCLPRQARDCIAGCTHDETRI